MTGTLVTLLSCQKTSKRV